LKDYANSKVPVLFEILECKGITGSQLASGIGVSTGNIFDWKSGRSAPKPEAICKIADYLNCSTDYLLGRTAAPEQPMQFQTTKEQQILAAYKAHPELQPAIDKLLGIEEETETGRAAARSDNDELIGKLKISKSKVKAALEDKSIKTDDDL
jgi:transcriptional regulator with XRE-family HTH domain